MPRTIVLYNPRCMFYTLPLALVAIGSAAQRAGWRVVIVDARLETDPVAALLKACADASCLGITMLTGAPIRGALEAARAVKAWRPAFPIIAGGAHPSIFPLQPLEDPAFDISVAGQGENALVEILQRLERGESCAGIPGVSVRDSGGAVPERRPLEDVNAYAPLDYGLLPMEAYFAKKGRRQLDYISSAGCNFDCAFCSEPLVSQRRWSGLEPERVGEELETLVRRYRITDVNFQDELFFTQFKRARAIAHQLIDRRLDVSWAATLRADQCARMSEEDLLLFKRSGLRRVLIGVEAGSQEMMDRISKRITVEEVFASAEKCKRHGIASPARATRASGAPCAWRGGSAP